jgi:hypothetical protein
LLADIFSSAANSFDIESSPSATLEACRMPSPTRPAKCGTSTPCFATQLTTQNESDHGRRQVNPQTYRLYLA